METHLKNPPLVMAGLVLGLFALGNLLEAYSPLLRYVLGAVGMLLWGLLIRGMISHPESFRSQLTQPLIASVFTTFFMTGMIFSSYVMLFASFGTWVTILAKTIWWLSFVGIVLFMINFSRKYLLHFSMDNVFPSWTVLYVGIGVASLTAAISHQFLLGQIVFWYGLVATLLVLPIVCYKGYKIGLDEATKPNLTTICAPMSLITAGYASTFETPNKTLLVLLIILSQLFYFFILVQLPKLMGRKFSPGFSAFTFPLVISATSLKLSVQVLGLTGFWLTLINVECLIAAIVVLMVLSGYLNYLKQADK